MQLELALRPQHPVQRNLQELGEGRSRKWRYSIFEKYVLPEEYLILKEYEMPQAGFLDIL